MAPRRIFLLTEISLGLRAPGLAPNATKVKALDDSVTCSRRYPRAGPLNFEAKIEFSQENTRPPIQNRSAPVTLDITFNHGVFYEISAYSFKNSRR